MTSGGSTATTEPIEQHPQRERMGIAFKITIVLATLLSTVSMFAVWANRNILDPGNWASNSTKLLQDPTIRTTAATYLTDQIYTNVNVQQEIAKALPDQASALAGPAASALRGVAQDAINKALGTAVVQSVWEVANRFAAEQFINVIDEKSAGAVNYQGNAVKLDLRPAALSLAGKVGLEKQAQQIPPGAANITVFSSNAIGEVRTIFQFLNAVALIFPLAALALYSIAVAASPRRRRRAVLSVGWSLIVAGVLALLIRNLAEGPFLDALAKTAAVRPAAAAAWAIATSSVGSITGNTITIAVVLILAAMLAGPRSGAVALREWAAPWVNERPGIGYAGAYALLFLILLWGPIPATREWLPALILIALTGIGVWALERQIAEEFPDASADEQVESLQEVWEKVRSGFGAGVSRGSAAAREAAGQVRERVSSGRDGAAEAATQAEAATEVPEASAAVDHARSVDRPLGADRLELLERLGALHASKILSDEEFEVEKSKVLSAR